MAASYAWTMESATAADGATSSAFTGTALTKYNALTKNAATLSIPAADLADFKGSSTGYIKVMLAYTADGAGSASVVESRVITLNACPAN